jgi:hypothetical protein
MEKQNEGVGSAGDKIPVPANPPAKENNPGEKYLREAGKIEDIPGEKPPGDNEDEKEKR